MKSRLFFFLPLFLTIVSAKSEEVPFRFAGIFSDNAVLQRDAPVPVWGFANPGETISIQFGHQQKSTTVGDDGSWRVNLDSLSANAKPRNLTAKNGDETIVLRDLLVGEVWLCSGQSNMAMRVDRAKDPAKEKKASSLPRLRVFTVNRKAAPEPIPDVTGSWVVSSPETAGHFSATAFFFGREIHREVDVPVGLIVSAWSGSAIEAWTSREVQEQTPELKPLLESWAEKDSAYTPEVASRLEKEYEEQIAKWKPLRDVAVKEGKEKPRPPRRPVDPRIHHHHPYVLFNGMIAPLIPYGIRGAIWYQGETNGLTPESAALYETQLPLLVNDWRKRWGQGDFPMAWMQLPTVSAKQVAWAPVREAMRRAQAELKHTGMAITMDLGEERLLHPLNKQAFAHRLALWARSAVYGQKDLVSSGPVPVSHRFGKSRVAVTFDHAYGGLQFDGDSVEGFEMRDDKGEWHVASATIRGADTVVIHSEEAGSPLAVRYAWGNNPPGNLENEGGLPGSPFLLESKTGKPPTGANAAAPAKRKSNTPPPTKPPLDPVEIGKLPDGMERLDLYLLMGQSNMKGRGVMPGEPLRDPQIVMMHKKTDEWFLARHPLHLVGDPETFEGHDNAGVGPGLAFGEAMAAKDPNTRIGLIPCAVGGTRIGLWQPGAKLYEDAVRRARLAVSKGPEGKTRVAGAIWLQGEADAKEDRIGAYTDSLHTMITGLRKDLDEPELPFIVTTILELRDDLGLRRAINEKLLALPEELPHTAGVDGRDLSGHIGDKVHIDTPSQNEIGRRFAEKMILLQAASLRGE